MIGAERLGNRLTRGGLAGSLAVFLWLGSAVAVPAEVTVRVLGVRHFTSPEHTRVVLDLSGPTAFEVRRVGEPERLAINVAGAGFSPDAYGLQSEPENLPGGLVQMVRTNEDGHRAQVVIELARQSDFRSFSLSAANGRPDRIVVDVLRGESRLVGPGVESVSGADEHVLESAVIVPEAAQPAAMIPAKPFTVIIDPGHGGLDPGAVRAGVVEKDVVLEIAREMARLINALPGYRAELTRTGDYGLELWERVAFARRQEGDVFLSIHGNTHPAGEVGGMEVYFLSLQKATDSRAAELADRENAAQLVGLPPGEEQGALVLDILLDLKADRILHESSCLAYDILAAGQGSGLVAGRAVKQAGFHVLRNLAMPSALVEVAYLSHPADLKVLQDRGGRRALAAAIVSGVVAWRSDEPAQLQLAAGRSTTWTRAYQVRLGDSLWDLARRCGTTVAEISRHNSLQTGLISVGQNLQLPELGQEP